MASEFSLKPFVKMFISMRKAGFETENMTFNT